MIEEVKKGQYVWFVIPQELSKELEEEYGVPVKYLDSPMGKDVLIF